MYLKYYLEPLFRKNKKGRFGAFGKNEFTKINSTMIKNLNITVPIPLAADGSYNIETQREIAERYKQIDEIKRGIINSAIICEYNLSTKTFGNKITTMKNAKCG